MTTTLEDLAVVGRRVTLTFHRDLKRADPPAHPGIVTGVSDDQAALWIRLDGKRCNMAARSDYEGLSYLDEVVLVPALPMGPFTPVADAKNAIYEKDGVLYAAIGEDGDDLVIVTDDRAKAWDVASAYFREAGIGIDPDYVDASDLQPHWAVFEWEPEDAKCPWTVQFAEEGDDHAVHIFYLPA